MPSGEPMSPARTITDEELLQLPKDGNKYEVVDGELVVMSPAGMRHEDIVTQLTSVLWNFVKEHGLGRAYGPDLLYVLSSGNKRRPDVSFIGSERLAAIPPGTVFPATAPDLAAARLSLPLGGSARLSSRGLPFGGCGSTAARHSPFTRGAIKRRTNPIATSQNESTPRPGMRKILS